MFMVSLIGYDVSTYEESRGDVKKINLLQDLELLKTLLSRQYSFQEIPVVLCFTYIDAFVKKIRHVPLTAAFPEYNGQGERRAIEYIVSKFTEVVPHRKVYPVVVNTLGKN